MAKTTRQVQVLARLFRVLGEPTRVSILMSLQDRECNVGELCRRLHLAQPTASHHLGILRAHGLVVGRREGKEVFYSVVAERFASAARAARVLVGPGAALRIGPLLLGLART